MSLAELYNKSTWLIIAGLLFITAVIAAVPAAVPLLGLGAIGGLASRILRIASAQSVPADYGALWAPLFLAPVLGALLGWAGILVLELGKNVDVIALESIDLTNTQSEPVLALALLFGFTERFFNGVANLVADKVGAGPASSAKEAEDIPPSGGSREFELETDETRTREEERLIEKHKEEHKSRPEETEEGREEPGDDETQGAPGDNEHETGDVPTESAQPELQGAQGEAVESPQRRRPRGGSTGP